jgi:hypothetical protein
MRGRIYFIFKKMLIYVILAYSFVAVIIPVFGEFSAGIELFPSNGCEI